MIYTTHINVDFTGVVVVCSLWTRILGVELSPFWAVVTGRAWEGSGCGNQAIVAYGFPRTNKIVY